MSTSERHARLFRNGRNQALRIPREFELPGDEVSLTKDGERLIVRPLHRDRGLAALLASWKPLRESFPDVDAGLPAPDDVTL